MSLRLSAHPARLAGIEGRKGALEPGLDADAAVFEVAAREGPAIFGGAGGPQIYPGFQSRLRLRHLFLRGRTLISDGAWTATDRAPGRCLWTT
jgi:dihydroorotase-like cyclic amidohydrolase